MSLNSDELSVATITTSHFVTELVTTGDSGKIDEIARKGAVSWGALRAVTLLACYRQKQLFESLESRRQAVAQTGYSSWSNWLTSLDLPTSDGLVRQRCMEIHGYVAQGADWMTILNILAYSPTAGADVLQNIVGPDGLPAPHIDVSQLPGGSIQGLLETIASIPDPGQSRRLVSQLSGQVQIYATDALITDGQLYVNVVYEHPETNETLYLTVSAHTERGERVVLPENVAHWIVRKVGGTIL